MLKSDLFLLLRIANREPGGSLARYDLSLISPTVLTLAERLIVAGERERWAIWDQFLAQGAPCAAKLASEAEPSASEPTAAEPTASVPTASEPTIEQPGPDRAEPGIRMTRALDLKPRHIDWLWAGRVPLGMITMFAGDPKLGKSFVTISMAAALSRGRPLPWSDRPDRPGSTILISAEDDPARTIAPRLAAAGADLAKIHILESVERANGEQAIPTVRADIDAITSAAARLGDCRLIVIDPISAYLSGVDDNRNAALRAAFSPLKGLAERLNAAVVLVSHLSKVGPNNGKRRVLGSIAYVGVSRANFLFAADPEDPTGRRVLMLDNGGNVAALAPTLAYVIDDRGAGAQVTWSDESVSTTVEQALRPRLSRPDREEQAFFGRECDQWLREMLADGPVSHAKIVSTGRNAGFKHETLRRAKERIGATAFREGFGPGSQFYWRMKK